MSGSFEFGHASVTACSLKIQFSPLLFTIVCLFKKYIFLFYLLHIRCIQRFTSFSPGMNESVSQHLLFFLILDKKE